jgi:hypothetical protein
MTTEVAGQEGWVDSLAESSVHLMRATQAGRIKWRHFGGPKSDTWACRFGNIQIGVIVEKLSDDADWVISAAGDIFCYETAAMAPDFIETIKQSNPAEESEEEFFKSAHVVVEVLRQALMEIPQA